MQVDDWIVDQLLRSNSEEQKIISKAWRIPVDTSAIEKGLVGEKLKESEEERLQKK